MMNFSLTPWGRVAVLAGGAGVVAIAVIVVVCVVGPGCWLNTIFLNDERKRKSNKKRQSVYCGETPSLKLTEYQNQKIVSYPDLEVCTPTPGTNSKPLTLSTTPLGQNGGGPNESQALLGALSSKRDSTYSSMSEQSGRTSPTNSCRSSMGESGGGSVVGSPVSGEAQGQVTFTVQYVATSEERNSGKLIVTIQSARGLVGKEYLSGACDPFMKVVIWRERRSIRKVKSPPLHVFRTRIIRHSHTPDFNQSFVVDVTKADLKELVVKVVAMDSDKWVSPTALGEVTQYLRDIKNLSSCDQKIPLNFFLAPPKLDLGNVLFGISYLPTAQRLSVSVIKANSLKYSETVNDIKDFYPYIRVLLVNASGRVIKKKKTTFRLATASPVWNETLIFDLPPTQVKNITFILAVCTRHDVTPSNNNDDNAPPCDILIDPSHELAPPTYTQRPRSPSRDSHSSRKLDKYLGKVILGCHVRGEAEKNHWLGVMAAPRKVMSEWHSLK